MSQLFPTCRVCGCTEDQACMTEDGPCSWVEPDLCSGCIGREDPLPWLTDEQLEVCWWTALAFGDVNRSAFNPQPEPITHLGTALRECIRRAMKLHEPEEETGLFDARVCRVCGCTDDEACVDAEGMPCHWVEWDLCSQCEAVDARQSLAKRQNAVITLNVSSAPPGYCMHCGMPR